MIDYKSILKEELIPALGCTEPIAIALAAANAAHLTDEPPMLIDVYASGSIIKNANSVYVPNSGGLQGVHISAALGAFVARPDLDLRVLEAADDNSRREAAKMVEEKRVSLQLQTNVDNVYIRVDVQTQNHRCSATISRAHTRLSHLEMDGVVHLHLSDEEVLDEQHPDDRSQIRLKSIFEYTNTVSFDENPDLKALLERQITTNMAIAKESLDGKWGQQVGKSLMSIAEGNSALIAIAHAAAGSDARMAGCISPVTINAGSGNQGITCSVPVVCMAQSMGLPHEKLLRGLLLSNLIAIYEKQFIGKLSAFCGAVSAAAAAGCGVAYLHDYDLPIIEKTLTNTLAASGGIICDGAKGSCAMKIAVSLFNAFLGMNIASQGLSFQPGDGIVGNTAEETIRHIGTVAAIGMVPTDKTILQIMTDQANQ